MYRQTLKAVAKFLFLVLLGSWNKCCSVSGKTARVTLTSINCALDDCDGCRSSVTIDGNEYSPQRDGMNVVVVDPEDMVVTSTYAFSKSMVSSFREFIQAVDPHALILVTSQLHCERSSATDLIVQRSIMNGLRELGALNRTTVSPLVLRSATMVLCKENCHPNMTSSLKIPFSMIQRLDEDSIMAYFTISYKDRPEKLSAESGLKSESSSTRGLLITTIGASSSLACILLISVTSIIFIRSRRRRRSASTSSNLVQRNDCELIACSTRGDGVARRREHPCRVGRGSLEQSSTYRLFSEYVGPDDNLLLSSFATYIQVDQENRRPVLYKIPSGVAKYDPPRHPPPYSKHRQPASRASSTDSYLQPHEYASPGRDGDLVKGEDISKNLPATGNARVHHVSEANRPSPEGHMQAFQPYAYASLYFPNKRSSSENPDLQGYTAIAPQG